MEKTKFKKGDIVYWQDLKGVVIDTDIDNPYPIRVKFTNDYSDGFTNDGRHLSFSPPVLSHTPYTLNGFTQNEVIEKDTLVWVRESSDEIWHQRFYSHCENEKHYCFKYQRTSKETDEKAWWTFVETTNPLIK